MSRCICFCLCVVLIFSLDWCDVTWWQHMCSYTKWISIDSITKSGPKVICVDKFWVGALFYFCVIDFLIGLMWCGLVTKYGFIYQVNFNRLHYQHASQSDMLCACVSMCIFWCFLLLNFLLDWCDVAWWHNMCSDPTWISTYSITKSDPTVICVVNLWVGALLLFFVLLIL